MYGTDLNLTSATAKVNAEGKITEVKIDELQSKEGNWLEQTKQQKGYAYRMHGQRDLSEADYKAYLKENDKLEWF